MALAPAKGSLLTPSKVFWLSLSSSAAFYTQMFSGAREHSEWSPIFTPCKGLNACFHGSNRIKCQQPRWFLTIY
jgi:hypothetical protein